MQTELEVLQDIAASNIEIRNQTQQFAGVQGAVVTYQYQQQLPLLQSLDARGAAGEQMLTLAAFGVFFLIGWFVWGKMSRMGGVGFAGRGAS